VGMRSRDTGTKVRYFPTFSHFGVKKVLLSVIFMTKQKTILIYSCLSMYIFSPLKVKKDQKNGFSVSNLPIEAKNKMSGKKWKQN
jgi:hypothetical protein